MARPAKCAPEYGLIGDASRQPLINASVRTRQGTGRRDAAIESAALQAMMRQQSGGGGISVRAAPCLKALPTRNRVPLPCVA
jgi:hypothetical protein